MKTTNTPKVVSIKTKKVMTTESVEATSAANPMMEAFSAPVAPVESSMVYREMADIPVSELDLCEQVQDNLKMLMDLQGRLAFSLREIAYLIKA